MLKEKDIYWAWRKRFQFPVATYEKKANQELQKIRRTRSTNLGKVQKQIQKHHLVIIGDDLLVSNQTKILENLVQARNKSTVLITNRLLQKNDWTQTLKKRKISVVRIRADDFESQSKALIQAIERYGKKYQHVFVWTGNLRLPQREFQKKLKKMNPLYVHLDSNVLRWSNPSKAWITWKSNEVGFVGTSSLFSVNLLRAMDEKDNDIILPQNLEREFQSMLKKFAKLFTQASYEKPNIIHLFNEQGIRRLNAIKNVKIKKFCEERAKNAESAMIPNGRIVLLSSAQRSHLAEEAAHYLRLVRARNSDFGNTSVIIEEALAFFASLLIAPARKIPNRNQNMSLWDHVHHAGYSLGFQLWKKWNQSTKARQSIRKLWHIHPKNEIEADWMLTDLVEVK